jgi:hypothetical protein
MDLKTCILGCVPPILAMLAEKWSPVSRSVVLQQSRELAPQHIVDRNQGKRQMDGEIDALSQTMTGLTLGASEASGLVPTWISVTSGFTAVTVEIVNPVVCVVAVAIVTGAIAIYGFRFFSTLNFYLFGNTAGTWIGCRRTDTKAECVSRGVIVLNGLVVVAVIAVWLFTSAHPQPAAPCPAGD